MILPKNCDMLDEITVTQINQWVLLLAIQKLFSTYLKLHSYAEINKYH